MKLLMIAMITLAPALYAQEKPEILASAKEKIIANLDQKINALEADKSCIHGATTREQFKACREKHRATMKQLREENKEERAAWKNEMESKRQVTK